MSEENAAKLFKKLKKIKFDILNRCKDVEDKYGPEKSSSFIWHKTKSVMQNFIFWKIPKFGIISGVDVKTAIYQLEKDGLIELTDRNHFRLTPKGSELTKEIRTTRIEDIPDKLLGIPPAGLTEDTKTTRCSNCGKKIEVDSTFCKYCGPK
ncbi:MAG: zinc ribbon domain-containing protein, partial [Promethearchaeota archaeon]